MGLNVERFRAWGLFLRKIVLFVCVMLPAFVAATIIRRPGIAPNIVFETTSEGLVVAGYNGTVTNLVIPEKKDGVAVVGIKDFAFNRCETLVTVTIPNSVTNIGSSAFIHCTNLNEITVSTDNYAYFDKGGVLFNKDQTTLVCYPAGRLGPYTIPNSVANIGFGAFVGCRLTSVTIPDSVTSIGNNAFYGCSGLTAIYLPRALSSYESKEKSGNSATVIYY